MSFDARLRNGPALTRFWAKVNKTETCWLWVGARSQNGYGAFKLHGVQWTASRLSYVWNIGPIPDRLQVCHHCDVPLCVRPSHLFLGTAKDNRVDCHRKGRQALGARTRPERRAKGEDVNTAKITAADVPIIRQRIAAGQSLSQIGRDYGLSKVAIRYIGIRRNWKHVP